MGNSLKATKPTEKLEQKIFLLTNGYSLEQCISQKIPSVMIIASSHQLIVSLI